MCEVDRLPAVLMDKMAIKQSVDYNGGKDELKGFEDFGILGKTNDVSNHAMAFFVGGLVMKWKQPVGYFLSSGPMAGKAMKSLLFDCINKLTERGLIVKVVICDQGSYNRNLFESVLQVNEQKSYFVVSVDKVYVLYDPPHLLKNIRNNLKRHGFIVATQSVS